MPITLSINRVGHLIIRFDYTEERVQKIRGITGRSWNPKERYWTIPCERGPLRSFFDLFAEEEMVMGPYVKTLVNELLPENKYEEHYNMLFKRADEELKLKGYSPDTHRSYLGHMRRFLLYSKKEPEFFG